MGYEVLIDHTQLSEEKENAIAPIISEETSSGIRICRAIVTKVYDEDGLLIETRITFGKALDAYALLSKMED